MVEVRFLVSWCGDFLPHAISGSLFSGPENHSQISKVNWSYFFPNWADPSFSGGSGRGGGRRQRRGEDVVHPLKVSLEDLYNGTSKKLSLSRNVICSKCKG